MDLSHLLKQCHVLTAVQSSAELLPTNQPAVYAFYEALDFSRGSLIDEIDSYVTKNGRHVALKQDEWPFSLQIGFRGNPSRFRGEGRALCQALPKPQHQPLQQLLLFLSFLSEPLYVGKTEDIKVRFRAHHDNGFLWKMKESFKRPPNEFVILAFFAEASQVRLLESILIQAINPPFCDQKT